MPHVQHTCLPYSTNQILHLQRYSCSFIVHSTAPYRSPRRLLFSQLCIGWKNLRCPQPRFKDTVKMTWHLYSTFFFGRKRGETLFIVVTHYLVPFTAATGVFFPLFLQRIVGILEFVSFTLRKLKLFLAVLHKSCYQNINH